MIVYTVYTYVSVHTSAVIEISIADPNIIFIIITETRAIVLILRRRFVKNWIFNLIIT